MVRPTLTADEIEAATGIDTDLPAAERQHCLRRAIAESKARQLRERELLIRDRPYLLLRHYRKPRHWGVA